MEKIFRIFSKEYGNVNQAALLLGFFTFLSQILALFRDRFIAHFIGPSPELDAYYAAFRVPDLIFICLASLASITVLVPFILAKMEDGNATLEARKFLNDVFTVFLTMLVFVSRQLRIVTTIVKKTRLFYQVLKIILTMCSNILAVF